jgi:hypothetical protein
VTIIMPDLNFDPKSAVPDLSGKVILITGGKRNIINPFHTTAKIT